MKMAVVDSKVNKTSIPHHCIATCECPILALNSIVYADIMVCIETTIRPLNLFE
jgi:hypothetical protein